MTVNELISALEDYLYEDKQGRYRSFLYVYGGDHTDTTINSVYYRRGDVILQSNETDTRQWSLIVPYIIHCLKFFKGDTHVLVQVCDEDCDYEYFDPGSTTVANSGDFMLLMGPIEY